MLRGGIFSQAMATAENFVLTEGPRAIRFCSALVHTHNNHNPVVTTIGHSVENIQYGFRKGKSTTDAINPGQ